MSECLSAARNKVLKDKFGEDFGSFGDAFLLAAMPMIRLLRLVRRFTYMQLLKAATWQQVAKTAFNVSLVSVQHHEPNIMLVCMRSPRGTNLRPS